MRICVLTQYFFPHAGGSQEYIVQLYQTLRSLDPSIAVDVICYNTTGAAKTEVYKGLTIHRVGCLEVLPDQFAIPNYLELFQLLKKLKAQHDYAIVNTHTRFFDNSWWAPLVARYFGARLILTDHCATHPTHPNSLLQKFITLFDKLLLKTVLHTYKNIAVVSQSTQHFLKTFGHNSTVFVAGVDSVFQKQQEKQQKTLHLPAHSTCITYLGRMIQSKNPQALFDAATLITQKYPKVLVVFAGAGEAYEKLKTEQTERIIFLGQVTRAQAAELLKATDIFVYPSQHHEGLPISILEAGASGCTVLATDNGGTTEVIHDHQTGLIIKPTGSDIAEKITYLIEYPEIRTKLATALEKKVHTEFDWQQTGKRYLQYLQTIC